LSLLNQNGTLGANAYEVMAIFSQADTEAMGRIGSPPNIFNNIALSSLGFSLSLPDAGRAPNHSFQFNYQSADTHLFWEAIVSA
jgi:hypothetical protein